MRTPRCDSPMAGRLYSCRETAQFLDISDDTVRRMIHDGHLEAVRIGRRCLRVLGESIENYIHKNKGLYRLVVTGRARWSVSTKKAESGGVNAECEGGDTEV
jgi:excisionase family DNA binding protein